MRALRHWIVAPMVLLAGLAIRPRTALAQGAPDADTEHCAGAEQSALRAVDLRFDGDVALPASELRCALLQRFEQRPLPDFRDASAREPFLENLRLHLLALYYDDGYLLAEVAPATVAIDAVSGAVTVHLGVLREGPRFRTRAVSIVAVDEQGAPIAPPGGVAALEARTLVHQGEWFSRSDAVRTIRAIEQMYRDAGDANVRVAPSILTDAVHGTVDFTLRIQRPGGTPRAVTSPGVHPDGDWN